MIADLATSFAAATHNGKPALANTSKTPERSGWELLAWAILEQAVDDLVLFCRFGIVTQAGKCLPWPRTVKRRIKWTTKGPRYSYDRVPHAIASCKGPNDHKQLCAWFQSEDAESFCDLIGCRMPPREIFWSIIKNHGGLRHVA
jgi:hypothetical protein